MTIQPISDLPSSAKRWALIVGVDQYQDPHIPTLGGAGNDARTLAEMLEAYAGFPTDQIIVLATGEPPERQPTRVNILRRLANIRGLLPRDGLFLFSFSGHGIERDGKGFLIPSDAQLSDDVEFLEETALGLESIKSHVRGMKTNQALLLIDACRSDPAVGPDHSRADGGTTLSQRFVDALSFDVKNRDVQAFAVLYAASVGQKAYEYTEKKQGYFTWALVQGLRGGAANQNGDVTLSGLISYVQQVIPKRIAIDLGPKTKQNPFAVIEGYRADELILASPLKRTSVAVPVALPRPELPAPGGTPGGTPALPGASGPALGHAPALTSVQALLRSRYPEARVLADGTRESRAILIVKQRGIRSYPIADGFFWPNYYKADDQVRQARMLTYHGSQPLSYAKVRFLPVGQQALIRKLTIKDAEVNFRLETIPDPYLAEVQVRFEKKFLATHTFPEVQKIIEQVLGLK